ncbi:hypothetical protein CLD22_17385, partial [Rubrivivax gelatinosus]|nr:hypothetical protein [Rubrivivax gelatinosus]
MLDGLTRISGLWLRWRESSGAYLVMTAEEYQRELTVFHEEQTLVLPLRHHNVVAAANALKALFGSRVRLAEPREEALGERLASGDLRRGGALAEEVDVEGAVELVVQADFDDAHLQQHLAR